MELPGQKELIEWQHRSDRVHAEDRVGLAV
jgi:hypothetical protein